MAKVRIYALAKELGLDSSKMLEVLAEMGVEAKSASSTLDEDVVETVKALLSTGGGGETSSATTVPEASTESQAEKAESKKTNEAKPEKKKAADPIKEAAKEPEAAPKKDIPHRPPVVTIMGHVDHGKTSLLDYIRKTKVAEKEAGGITQHVGAFEAQTKGGKVVFIDTPGHEAFTTIRQRGANVADIAVIVIAADDSIMPQTREAVAHARAAKVPIVVAINKTDLPGANPDKVKQDLFGLELVPEEYGGETIVVPLSAKTGDGVDNLLENLALLAELEDLRADPDGVFKGVVIEAKVDKQAGVLTNVIVQEGRVSVGDFLVVGETYGKIRAMTDSAGERMAQAIPGNAVQILGFSDTPVAGEVVSRANNEHDARQIVQERKDLRRELEEDAERAKPNPGIAAGLTIEDLLGAPGEVKVERQVLNLILRADTQGSLEALQGILAKQEGSEVDLNLMFAGIGAPTEGDILLASTANALILGFNVVPSGSVKKMAETKKLEIKSYRIIYELIDEVKRLLRGSQAPVLEEQQIGKAEVRMVIPVSKAGGNVAGSYITEGKVVRNARVRILRNKKEIHRGQVQGLKRFKDDAREVLQGYECGIIISNYDEFEVGDVFEFSEMVEVPRS